jgi:undecaprenyl diphosphate synthase
MTLPRHVAIIMDGNGRWAQQRGQARHAGHSAGVAPLRMCIEECAKRHIEALTVFAFSSENWGRPSEEVDALMNLFVEALDREMDELHRNGVRLRFVGERQAFSSRLQSRLAAAEAKTQANQGLKLQVAVSYGGRWDITNAAKQLAARVVSGALRLDGITEIQFGEGLQLADLPEPDLFIRTGGERRISNFLLWDLAYTELYFCEDLWPDFNASGFAAALDYFAQRQRRFGLTEAASDGIA